MKRHLTPGPTASRRRILGALAIAAVFALKLAAVLQLNHHPLLQPEAGSDSAVYIGLARQVVAGNLSLGPGLYVASPFYIYFLALVLWLKDSLLWVRLAQAALGTGAVVCVFRTADIWHGRRAAWIAGALASFTGVFTFSETLLLETAVDPVLTAFALLLLARALQSDGRRHRHGTSLPAGLAMGALILNHPQMLLAATGISILLFVRRRLPMAMLFGAGIVVSLTPLLLRNYAVAGDVSPVSSHGGLSFYIGNNPGADGTDRPIDGVTPSLAGQRDARQLAERAIGRPLDDSEVSAHFYGQGWKWILGQPAQAVGIFVRKLALVFNAAHPARQYSYEYYLRNERNVLRYLPVGPWLLVPLGLIGLWIGRPSDPARREAFWLWGSFIFFGALAIAAFFVSTRVRLPILIPLCATAGGAVSALSMLRAARLRIVAVAGAIAALALVANWPFDLEDGRREERTRMALWLISQERYAEAESRITEIERGHPQPGMLHFRVGRAFMARRQTEDAVRHLQRARSLDQSQPEIALVLGEALLAARRAKEAIPHLRRALEAGVRRDLAGFDLARAYAAAGDRTNAVQTLQAVRPSRPDDAERWRDLGSLALDLEVPRLAEAFLRQSLKVEPNSVDGYKKLGLAIALSGRHEEAIDAFETAVRLDARDAAARLNLAVAYAETGRLSEARQQADEALRLDPSYEKARHFISALGAKPARGGRNPR